VDTGLPQDVLQDAVAESRNTLLGCEQGLHALPTDARFADEAVEVGPVKGLGKLRGLRACGVVARVVEVARREGPQATVHLHGRRERGPVVELDEQLVLPRTRIARSESPQGNTLGEQQARVFDVDFDEATVTPRGAEGSAGQPISVRRWIAVVPGECVWRGGGRRHAHTLAAQCLAELPYQRDGLRNLDHRRTSQRGVWPPRRPHPAVIVSL